LVGKCKMIAPFGCPRALSPNDRSDDIRALLLNFCFLLIYRHDAAWEDWGEASYLPIVRLHKFCPYRLGKSRLYALRVFFLLGINI